MKIREVIFVFVVLTLLFSVNVFCDEEDRTYEHETTYTVVEIKLFEDDVEVVDDAEFGDGTSKVVWIENDDNGNPEMPDLRIIFDPKASIKCYMTMRLKVEYYVNLNGKQTSYYYTFKDGGTLTTAEDVDYFPDYDGDTSTCNTSGLNSENEVIYLREDESKIWDVDFQDYFCGGTATLYWQAFTEDAEIIAEGEYVFYIRGQNPDSENYVLPYIGDEKWYYKPILKHENAGKGQFNKVNLQDGNYGPDQSDYEGCPNWGFPDGWGYMQLEIHARYNRPDEGRVRSKERDHQVLWNWQYNIDTGVQVLEQKRIAANNWIKRQFADAVHYCYRIGDYSNVPVIPTLDENEYNNVEFDEPYWTFDEVQWNIDHPDNTEEESNEDENEDNPDENNEDEDTQNEEEDDNIIDPWEHTGGNVGGAEALRLLDQYITVSENAWNDTHTGVDNNDDITCIDAETIKLYNGGHLYIFMDDNSNDFPYGYWRLDEYELVNDKKQYYVKRVCAEYEND